MKGFVPTPPDVVDAMVTRLFHAALPTRNSAILDPGCGTGAFIHGIARWCRDQGRPLPRIVGVEQDADLVREARQSVAGLGSVRILNEDFLTPRNARFDYVIANPPYVPITGLWSSNARATENATARPEADSTYTYCSSKRHSGF